MKTTLGAILIFVGLIAVGVVAMVLGGLLIANAESN
jgi:hypothetical protein